MGAEAALIVKPGMGDLVMRHRGKRICIMGGGPNLASDLARVDAEVFISINAHGVRLQPPDYLLAMDAVHGGTKEEMGKYLRARDKTAPILGPWHWCDFQLTHWPLAPRFLLSGVVATWVAYLMGAHPVVLAGFDCYAKADGTGDGNTMSQHRDYLPFVKAQVRVASGPLIGMYPAFDPAELMPVYQPNDVLREEKLHDEVRVRVAHLVEIRGHEWPVGTLLTMPRHEVRRQIKHKSLVEV
jgi:hypothetical protein